LKFGQTIWDKTQVLLGTSWKCSWEHFGNLKPFGNMMGTRGKKNHIPPPQKIKFWVVHECMMSFLIGCMKFLFPKLLVTIFHLGYWQG